MSFGVANAADLSWDGDGQLPIDAGAGQWDSANARWFDGANLVNWNNANNDTAVFGPGSVAAQATESITFGGLKFQDSTALFLGTGGGYVWGGTALTLDTAAGTTSTVVPSIGASAGQTLTKTGSGTFRFFAGLASGAGTVSVQGGTLAFAGASADLSNNTRLEIATGATFEMGLVNDTFGSISGLGTIRLAPFSGLGIVTGSTLNVGIDNTSSTFAGNILGAGGRLTKSGTGNLTLSGVNTFTGNVSVAAGTLTLQGGAAIEDTAFVGLTTAGTPSLILLNDERIGALGSNGAATVDLGGNTLTIGADKWAAVQFGGVIQGSGKLIKVGSGQQQLNVSGNLSTYTGGTEIRGGQLMVIADRKLGTVPATPTVNVTLDGGAMINANTLNLTIDANRLIQLNAGGGTFSVFNSNTTNRVMIYGGVVSGAGKLIKDGPGVLTFTEQTGTTLLSNTYTGGTDIRDGQLTSQLATTGVAGTPLGTGSVSMSYGRLAFLPTPGTSDVLLAVATDPGRTFNYGPGSELTLGKNGNNSNQLTIGPVGAGASSLVRDAGGTLVVTPTTGVTELGLTTAGLRLLVNGGVPNANGGLAGVNGDMVTGAIVSTTNNTDFTGEFLRYDNTDGFKLATYSAATDINAATANDVFDANGGANKTLAADRSVHAINVRQGQTVDGSFKLTVGNGSGAAGVILNNGTISTNTLAFGGANGHLYAGGPGANFDSGINSDITGTAGITKTGTGILTLGFSGTLGYTGPTNVTNGILRLTANNQLPSSTFVTVGNTGTLNLNGTQQTVAGIAGKGAFVSGIDLGNDGRLTIGAGDSTFLGVILGAGNSTLVKDGAGVLTLGYPASNANLTSAANTFNKLVLKNGAVVSVSANVSLGAIPAGNADPALPGLPDAITLDGGTLRWTGVTIGANVPASGAAQGISTNRGIVIGPGGGTISITEAFEIVTYQRGNAEVIGTDNRNLITSADPLNPGTLTKTGAGFFRLGIGNTFAGKWVIKEGNLQFQQESALGVLAGFMPDGLTLDGGMIQSNGTGSLSPDRGITVTANGGTIQGFTFNGPVTGVGQITKIGANTSAFVASSPTWAGGILLSQGTVTVGADNALGTGALVSDNTNLVKVLNKTAAADVTLANNVVVNDNGMFDIRVSNGTLTLSGAISGAGTIYKGVNAASVGTVVLSSNTSTFTGDLIVNSGAVVVKGSQALGTAAGATMIGLDATLAFDGGVNYTLAEPTYVGGQGLGGAGALVNIAGVNNYAGSVNITRDTLVRSNADSLTVGAVRGGSALTVDGAGTFAAASIRTQSLNVNQGVTQITAKGTPNQAAGTSVVQSLAIAGGPTTPSAKLDLTDNSMIIDYTTVGTLVDDTRQLLLAGVNTGQGIVSSSATSTRRLGYGDNALLNKGNFGGQPVDTTSLLIKFTYSGDANLDGQVDINDLAALATSWQTNNVWTGGDFDYNGFVDINDLASLATNWQAGVGAPLAQTFEQALASVGLGGVSVPEPASLGILALGATSLIARRRRAN